MSTLHKAINRFNEIVVKNPMTFLIEREKNLKICMEPQKIPNNQINIENKEQNWRHLTSWFQTILQSYTNQNSMALA